MAGPLGRGVRVGVVLVLAASAVAVFWQLRDLSQTRYFTVDELQFGHAAWLVSEGRVPYVDFYEHHLPASYVLHAPLVAGDAPFVERALRLRHAAFAWLLLASLGLGVAAQVALKSPLAALLAAQLPLAFGFSALSAVDFRADNLAGFAWLGCLCALECNRQDRRAGPAALAGVLLALAVLSTQKLVLIGAAPIAVFLAIDSFRRGGEGPPLVARPVVFCVSGGALALLALAAAAVAGMLAPGFEATVRHAVEHEALYPEVALAPFVEPFLRETALSTGLLVGFAALGAGTRSGRFYLLPLAAALASGLWLRGKFPYNYLVPCVVGGLLAVRGYATLVRALVARAPRVEAFAPLLYLLPLLVLPEQLGFTDGRTSNAHQRHVLAKIERATAPGDVVIDAAGGALFRDHASHYFYHGPAHRAFLADYFETGLLEDLRASRAPLWIRDFRLKKLAPAVRRYFRTHYVRADGWLYALGTATAATGEVPLERELEVVRAGLYHAYPAPGGQVSASGSARGVSIDGRPVPAAGLRLEEGTVRLRVAAGSPPVVISPLPREVFLGRFPKMRPYTLLFEYERRPTQAWRERSVLTP